MLLLLAYFISFYASESVYFTRNGQVFFESKATLEKIRGHSNALNGVLNPKNQSFSFSIQLISFEGFNSQLQKEHYAENYVETELYPEARFTGKLIEDIEYKAPGIYQVRAKGNFKLHGITTTKIIHGTLHVIDWETIRILSQFQINLKEFEIKIPRLVHKKVAENIQVRVDLLMERTEKP